MDAQYYRASSPMSGIFDKQFELEASVLGKRKYVFYFGHIRLDMLYTYHLIFVSKQEMFPADSLYCALIRPVKVRQIPVH